MKYILHNFLKTTRTKVVIWYVWYDKIIVNIFPHQVINKQINTTRISVFVFVTFIISVLKISKGIVLLIQFNSVISWDVVLLFVIYQIFVLCSYRLYHWNKGNTCTLYQPCLWTTTSARFWCCCLSLNFHSLWYWLCKIIVICIISVYIQLYTKFKCICIRDNGEKRIPNNGKSIYQAQHVPLNFIVKMFCTWKWHRKTFP